MRYRDDLEVLIRRIEELEGLVVERRRERDRLNSLNNLGPEAHTLFSWAMYRLGRAIGRALSSRRPVRAHARQIEAARERVRLLEHRLGVLEDEVATARKLVEQKTEAARRAKD